MTIEPRNVAVSAPRMATFQPGMMGRGQPTVAPRPATMSPQLAASRRPVVAPAVPTSSMAPLAYAQSQYQEPGDPFSAAAQGWINASAAREEQDIEQAKRDQISEAMSAHPDLAKYVSSGIMEPADAIRIAGDRDALTKKTTTDQARKDEIGSYLTELAGSDERYVPIVEQWNAGVLDEDGVSALIQKVGEPVKEPTPTDDQRELNQINTEREAAGQPKLSLEEFLNSKKPPTTGTERKLTAAEIKELFEAQDGIIAGEAIVPMLGKMMELNKTAWDGPLADMGTAAGALLEDENSVDTQELKNLTTTQALEQLKAVFGGMPTEGERKILLEIQGSVGQPRAVRERIYQRAMEAAERRIASNRAKAEAIQTGGYRQPGYDPGVPEAPSELTGLSDEELLQQLTQ